jgi:hypothetical protein
VSFEYEKEMLAFNNLSMFGVGFPASCNIASGGLSLVHYECCVSVWTLSVIMCGMPLHCVFLRNSELCVGIGSCSIGWQP